MTLFEGEEKPREPAFKAKSLRKKPNLKPIPINQEKETTTTQNTPQQEISNSSLSILSLLPEFIKKK